MGRQEVTNPDTTRWTLTPQQEAAVDLLVSGKTVTDTAQALGVARQTVSEWLNRHHGFRAAVNRRRSELWSDLVEKLHGMVPKALQALEGALETESALTAAVHVLKACGLYGVQFNAGPTDPEDLEAIEQRQAIARADHDEVMELERAERKQELRQRAAFAATF